MKLKCDKHNRRVLTGKNGFLHRTGDMSPCDSMSATIGTEWLTVEQVKGLIDLRRPVGA